MTENPRSEQGRTLNTRRYTEQVLSEYLSIRNELTHITPALLRIFAQGNAEILVRAAAGLSANSPGHPDLPIIYSVIHEISTPKPSAAGPGKGRKPVHSIPYDEVPPDLLDVIRSSRYSSRTQENLIYALREILGAARRAGVEEEFNHGSLSALRSELYERGNSARGVEIKIGLWKTLGRLFGLPGDTIEIINNEARAARIAAEAEQSRLHIAFRQNPVSPLEYARLARVTSEEAYTSEGNRQTIHRLFITAAALSLLSFIPERVSDILKLTVGIEVTRDSRGWSSQYFSNKTNEDRSVEYLPDLLTPYLDDLILLGADPGPQGQNLLHLYRHRVTNHSPLFARTNLRKCYSRSRIFELVKECTGHGPHAARKSITDYMAEIGGTSEQIKDLLGHRCIATSEKHYAIFAESIRRRRTLREVAILREDLARDRTFRLPSGKLIDLNRIAKDLERSR